MNKKELLKKLKKLKDSGDKEAAHAMADDYLLEYINDEKITSAFKDIEKWYA